MRKTTVVPGSTTRKIIVDFHHTIGNQVKQINKWNNRGNKERIEKEKNERLKED
jgi:hypothetical protein